MIHLKRRRLARPPLVSPDFIFPSSSGNREHGKLPTYPVRLSLGQRADHRLCTARHRSCTVPESEILRCPALRRLAGQQQVFSNVLHHARIVQLQLRYYFSLFSLVQRQSERQLFCPDLSNSVFILYSVWSSLLAGSRGGRTPSWTMGKTAAWTWSAATSTVSLKWVITQTCKALQDHKSLRRTVLNHVERSYKWRIRITWSFARQTFTSRSSLFVKILAGILAIIADYSIFFSNNDIADRVKRKRHYAIRDYLTMSTFDGVVL